VKTFPVTITVIALFAIAAAIAEELVIPQQYRLKSALKMNAVAQSSILNPEPRCANTSI
jgi:hypothetical protein